MRWRPYPITLFDCDSTLSTIEGIDELAVSSGRQEEIAALTDSAMAGDVPLEQVYGHRLDIVNPTRADIRRIKDRYKATVVPDAKEVIDALAAAGNENWVVSGGLAEPVTEFATWLGIDADRVLAVGAHYDPLDGQWWDSDDTQAHRSRYADYDDRGHLHATNGKTAMIDTRVTTNGRRLLVGDGVSDLEAAEAVDLFVAFAGVVSRPAVVDAAPVVITSESLAPLLTLALGPERVTELLDGPHHDVARRSAELVDDGALRFNDPELARRFVHRVRTG